MHPASAKVTVGSKTYKIRNGSCDGTATVLLIDIGAGPNHILMQGSIANGKFSNDEVELTLGGKTFVVQSDSGTINAKGGSFKGTVINSRTKVKGSFTC